MSKPGGMLRWGIPGYRLPESVLDAEIQKILDLGVELRCGVSAGINNLRGNRHRITTGISDLSPFRSLVAAGVMTTKCREEIRDVILDSIVDGVFTVDENWRITCFNGAAQQITGVPLEEAIGQCCCDVLRASICGDDCALRQTMSTGRSVVCKPVYIVNAGGQRIPISISTAVLKDNQGRVIGGVETFRDLSVVEQLRKQLEAKYTFADIVARSAPMRRVLDILPQLAESNSTVLIEGASGTGKELIARAIHDLSRRCDKRFVAINCAALPDTLLESELFGYKAGAFTDAKQDKPGRFAFAEGGTILLDEIGDVSPAMQAKLLRVLQERVYEPLGAVEPVSADVRVIAATNRDLAKLVSEQTFRQDLYYRVKVVNVQLPPLCERRADIPLLVEHFISKFNKLEQKSILGAYEAVMLLLMEHDYSGNVRELENIIEHAFVLCRGGLIEVQHLPPELREQAGVKVPRAGGDITLRAVETLHITEILRRHGGNRDAAARALGIHRATLFRKIKSLGIDVPDSSGDRG
jgi:PAS domain S-box-containing protein